VFCAFTERTLAHKIKKKRKRRPIVYQHVINMQIYRKRTKKEVLKDKI
jgi:hypothetical protein